MSETKLDTRPEKNPRGIPRAPFISDVEEHIGGPEAEIEPVLLRFQDAIAKYRYMEANLTQRKSGLEEKIPDIKKTLAMVEYLQETREGKKAATDDGLEDDLDDGAEASGSKMPIRTTFELNETLYAEADLEETDTVYLWLGANVMLSYKVPDAIELLQSKLTVAEQNLMNLEADLEYLKEQVTIMEVNTARVFNWDVKRRRLLKEKEAGLGQKG